jgi:hypothetical protein
MSRTVIALNATGEKDPVTKLEVFQILVEKHSVNVPGMRLSKPLKLSAIPDWSAQDAVSARGRHLRDALREHAGIAAVLDGLGMLPAGSQAPLYVKMEAGDAESITWETLCDTSDKFFALDPRSPIGRITDPASTIERPTPLFRVPVRISAVISAIGISGQTAEWNTLRDAADATRAAGLPVEIQVLTGDSGLFAQVTQDIAANRPWVNVAGIDATGAKVASAIKRWQPNIVHFFCHGRGGDNEQQIELATATDFADPAVTTGSVTLNRDQLEKLGATLDNPWLIVLNCCEGAQASSDSMSLAHHVVSNAFPAALAMLEPVDATDAHEFTRAIYESLLSELNTVKQAMKAGTTYSFEWAAITHAARDAINSLHQGKAMAQREWALPALYVRGMRPMEFRFVDDTSDEVIAKQKSALDAMAEWLRSVSGSLAEDRRRSALEKAMTAAGVPKELWPSVDGSFSGD